MPFVPLHSNALRLGLYIKIEGSWFSHPFPTNSFKIKTAKELKTIQGLTKVKLYFDPDRSDPEWGQSEHVGGICSGTGPGRCRNRSRTLGRILLPGNHFLRGRESSRRSHSTKSRPTPSLPCLPGTFAKSWQSIP